MEGLPQGCAAARRRRHRGLYPPEQHRPHGGAGPSRRRAARADAGDGGRDGHRPQPERHLAKQDPASDAGGADTAAGRSARLEGLLLGRAAPRRRHHRGFPPSERHRQHGRAGLPGCPVARAGAGDGGWHSHWPQPKRHLAEPDPASNARRTKAAAGRLEGIFLGHAAVGRRGGGRLPPPERNRCDSRAGVPRLPAECAGGGDAGRRRQGPQPERPRTEPDPEGDARRAEATPGAPGRQAVPLGRQALPARLRLGCAAPRRRRH
mmetsp:Transcript_64647/g.187339  ORF Transcript_64647/g.187339 Transcript_64647/m.187339 type:complete len:264 (-) Transcript_64647:908-1699(-)